MRYFKTAAAALFAALMLASCGGSDSGAGSSAAETSAAESIAESIAESVPESNTESAAESSAAESIAESAAESTEESSAAAPTYKSIKLMTLGDSITDGFWLEGGYRVFLCNKLEENGLSQYVDLVGSKHSGNCYDNDHEGYTAYAIAAFSERGVGSRSGITKLAPEKIEEFQPDVLTLMIGTNDILSLYKLDEAGDRLEALVDSCFEALPEGAKLYLASLPDMDANDATYIDQEKFTPEFMDSCIADYNEKVKALVEKKQGEGRNIEFCDVHGVLAKSDLYDGVHPNEEGYTKLADYWYDIIAAYIAG